MIYGLQIARMAHAIDFDTLVLFVEIHMHN